MCNRAWVALPQDTPQHDSLWSLEPGNPTSGPYVVSEINSTEKAVLTKSETYFNKDAITMDSITFWCMPDQDAQAMNFESGDIDVALSVTSSAADKYTGTDTLQVIQDGTSYFIVMNSGETGPEYLKDVRVRRALALAIDKQPSPTCWAPNIIRCSTVISPMAQPASTGNSAMRPMPMVTP